MTDKIGKYRVKQNDDNLRITYVYTFSDLIGGFGHIVGFLFGLMTLYVVFKDFSTDIIYTFKFWFLFSIGLFLSCYLLYTLILALYSPRSGIIQVNRQKGEIIIRDFLKKQVLEISSIASIYCEINKTKRPKQNYGMFIIGTKNGKRIECFIIRSSIPIALDKKIEKDIYDTTTKLRTRIMEFIR